MRQPATLLAGIIATVMTISSANATMWITADRGGLIIDYAERFLQARAAGEQVVIDGACLSACTLVVGMLPRDQVCATPKAVLGFHAAWRPALHGGTLPSAAATQAMMDVYPPDLRNWIGRRGGLTPRMMFLRGRELAAIVPACGSIATASARATSDPRLVRSDPSRATVDDRHRR